MNKVTLETDRLYVRSLVSADVTQDYVDWLNDPEVNRFLESRFSRATFADVEQYVQSVSQDDDSYFLGIFLKSDQKHIGNIKLDAIDHYHRRGIIGLMLGDKQEWGKGYATEAIRVLTQYGLEELKLLKLSAGCYESNMGSKRAFEKVGYQIEGLLRNQVETGAGREGLWQMGILPSELI